LNGSYNKRQEEEDAYKDFAKKTYDIRRTVYSRDIKQMQPSKDEHLYKSWRRNVQCHSSKGQDPEDIFKQKGIDNCLS
jgi:hypothetical protein